MNPKTFHVATRCLLSASILAAAIAGQILRADPRVAQQPAPPFISAQKMTLADFAWLAGRWQGAWGLRAAQQVWMPARGGVMLGTFQLTENDKTLVLELFTLVAQPDGTNLYIRRFTPSLAAWEQAGPAVLHLSSLDPKTAVFDNPGEGQPRRTLFRRLDADTYVSHSEVAPENGAPRVTEITYHRQKEPRPSRH